MMNRLSILSRMPQHFKIPLLAQYRLLLALLMGCMFATPAWSQHFEIPEGCKQTPPGTIEWKEFGITFQMPTAASILEDSDEAYNLRIPDLDLNIRIKDRREYTDEDLGNLMLQQAEICQLDLNDVEIFNIGNGNFQGAIMEGSNPDGVHSIISIIENVKTLYAVKILIQTTSSGILMGQELMKSIHITPPDKLISD